MIEESLNSYLTALSNEKNELIEKMRNAEEFKNPCLEIMKELPNRLKEVGFSIGETTVDWRYGLLIVNIIPGESVRFFSQYTLPEAYKQAEELEKKLKIGKFEPNIGRFSLVGAKMPFNIMYDVERDMKL